MDAVTMHFATNPTVRKIIAVINPTADNVNIIMMVVWENREASFPPSFPEKKNRNIDHNRIQIQADILQVLITL